MKEIDVWYNWFVILLGIAVLICLVLGAIEIAEGSNQISNKAGYIYHIEIIVEQEVHRTLYEQCVEYAEKDNITFYDISIKDGYCYGLIGG